MLQKGEPMSDCMTFPDTVEEYMEQYKVVDADGIYMSKGAELVPIFRMRQWFEHLPSAQPELIERTAYIRGFEQGRTQGMIDAQGEKNMIKAEWTNADALNLQPTCNQLATDCVRRIISYLPSTQAEIIKCKDCKWKQGAECVRFAEVRPYPDDFCSRAERRTDDAPSAQPTVLNTKKLCEFWDSESNFCTLHRPSAQPERDIPMKPNETIDSSWGIRKKQAVCPKCDYYLNRIYFLGDSKNKKVTYCETCGQAIDWEGWDWEDE